MEAGARTADGVEASNAALAVENAGDVAAGGRISPDAAAGAGVLKPLVLDLGGVIAAVAVPLVGNVRPPCGIAGGVA